MYFEHIEAPILDYLFSEIEPVVDAAAYNFGETIYRAAVSLRDKTYLPCVEFRPVPSHLRQSVDQFLERRGSKQSGEIDLFSFCFGTQSLLSPFHIESVSPSPYAISLPHRELLYEAADALNIDFISQCLSFVADMSDGKKFSFHFSAGMEFIGLPDGYTVKDIDIIIPNKRLPDKSSHVRIPFICYLYGL